MRGHLKKSLALVLAALTAVAALSGCSGNKSASRSDSGKKVHTLKVLAPERSDSTRSGIKFSERDKYSCWKTMDSELKSKGLNLQFEVVPYDQYKVTIQTRMAAAVDLPDFVNISALDDATALKMGENGILLPVNKIIDKYSDGSAKAFFKKYDFAVKLTTAPDGNRYWLPDIQTTSYGGKPGSTCEPILIRKDWLDKLNLKAPTNADEFLNVMKEFRDKDANGNGKKDEILNVDFSTFFNGVAQWFGLGMDTISIDIQNKKVVSPWYQKGIKDYFKYVKQLVASGVYDTSLIGATADITDQKSAENKFGAYCDYCMETYLEPAINTPNAQLLPIGPLTAVSGIDPVNVIETPELCWNKYAFTKNCKDLQGAAKLIDILWSDNYELESTWGGIKGVTYDENNGVKVLKPEYQNSQWKQQVASGKCLGDMLWGDSVFPHLRFTAMEAEISQNPSWKQDYQKSVINYPHTVPDSNSSWLAIPTDDQRTQITSITNDLDTYSKELATDLVTGKKSLDGWDDYMAKLKQLGLDDLIKINQDRLNKFLSK